MGSFYVRKWRTQTGGVLSPEDTFTPKTDSPSAQKFRHGLIVSDSDHKHYFPMPNRSNRPEFEFVCDMEGRGHADFKPEFLVLYQASRLCLGMQFLLNAWWYPQGRSVHAGIVNGFVVRSKVPVVFR